MKHRKINQLGNLTLCAIVVVVLGACATAQNEIMLKQNSTATGVFREVQNEEPRYKGTGDLLITASIKTPVAGYHFFETKTHLHGKPGYPFLLNIDGQAVVWKAAGVTEDAMQPGWAQEAGPEAGPGVRYVVEKRIRLAPGSHTVFFALPEEDYFTQNVIRLEEGRVNILEFRPIYSKSGRGLTENFLYGIKQYEVFLNGNRIR